MIVVSNTSPIINLAAIGRLAGLQQLYGEVIIPPAVYDEIVISGAGQPGAMEIGEAAWMKVQPIANQALATALRMELDAGEAEAIVLAVEMKADLLLIDERNGWRDYVEPEVLVTRYCLTASIKAF
jgi:predicted nucleic acid-binding protein